MKKVLVVLMFVAAGVTKSAGQSMLKVSLSDNTTQISVAVDERHFAKRGTSITVGDLPYGMHDVKIYAITYTRRGRGYEELIYDTKITTYAGQVSLLVYDPESGKDDVQEMAISDYQASHPAMRGRFNNNNQQQGQYNNDANNNQQNNGGYNNGDAASPVPPEKLSTLTDAKTDQLKTTVAAKATDTQKMSALKDGLKDEKITTAQIGTMLDWFVFDASKVEFAKWAYSITVDKEYFSDLENKFSYKTSQDDLDKFIKQQK